MGNRRIDEFAQRIREYEASTPIKHKRTETKIIIEREKSYPVDISLILGDAIHNLRTALDLLASELVQLNGQGMEEVYFPFARNAKELDKQIKKKHFDRAGLIAVNLLHKIEPHSEGNKPLRGLHDLDIKDKHQLILLPVAQFFQINNFLLKGPRGELATTIIRGLGDGISVSAKPEDKATWDSIRYTAVFDNDVPEVFRGQPIIETLKKLSDIVDKIIKAFSNLSNVGN